MTNSDITTAYNYDEFTPEKVLPWLSFESSPAAGATGPRFSPVAFRPISHHLSQIWQQNQLTVVEFGSFT
jgi:hypothetical protein